MTMLFCDSFDHYASAQIEQKWDYNQNVGNVTIQSSAGRRGGGALRINSGVELHKLIPSQPSELIVGFAFKTDALTCDYAWQFREGATNHVRFSIGASGQINVYRDTTLLMSSANGIIATGTYYYIEVRAKIHDTAGEVEVRVDGAVVIDNSGSPAALDSRNGGSGIISAVVLLGEIGQAHHYDDLVILDRTGTRNNWFLGDVRIDALLPAGNGNSSQFDGSDGNSTDNYLLVDDASTDSDSTYVESSTVGEIDTYAFGNLSHTPAQIHAVQIAAHTKKADAGTRRVSLVTRRSGTNYIESDERAVASDYRFLRQIRETDPSAASPNDWTKTAVDAAEFGIEVAA